MGQKARLASNLVPSNEIIASFELREVKVLPQLTSPPIGDDEGKMAFPPNGYFYPQSISTPVLFCGSA